MDADYISRMDNEVTLEPLQDYEAQAGNAYRPRNISDSFEPLEVSSAQLILLTNHVVNMALPLFRGALPCGGY